MLVHQRVLEMIGVALDHGLCPGCFNCCSKRQGYSGEQEQARRLSPQSSGYFGCGPWCLHGVLPPSVTWFGSTELSKLGQLSRILGQLVGSTRFYSWSQGTSPGSALCCIRTFFFFAFQIPEPRIRDCWVLHQPFFRGSHFHGPFFFLTVRFPHN